MAFAFRRSRIAFGTGLVLTAVLIILVWIRDRGGPLYIPIVASVLLAGIGAAASRLLANILASMENTRYLGYLHVELDPEKFLAAYEGVPARVKGKALVPLSYLADGYWAAGRFREAAALLEKEKPEEIAYMGLLASKLAAYRLAAGDRAGAEREMARLGNVVGLTRQKNPALSANLSDTLRLCEAHLHCLNKEPADTEFLSRAFARSQYELRRLEICQVQAMDALRAGRTADADEALTYLAEHGGKTFFPAWAEARRREV